MKILIENKAQLEAKNNDGSTALIMASNYGHPEVVRILLENGGQLDVKNNYS